MIGDGPERARARAAWPAELGLDGRVELAGQLDARRRRSSARARLRRLRHAQRRRGVRRRLRRGDGRGPAGRSARAASRARRRSPRAGDGLRLVAARRRRGARRGDRAPGRRPGLARGPRRARPRDRRARASPGSAAARRPCAPTPTRCDETRRGPVLFVTNHVPPDRAGAFAALHARQRHRARALRRPLAPRDRRASTTPASRTGASTSARSTRSPRPAATAPSSAGRPAASRCRRPGSGARRAGVPVRAVERALGRAAHAGPPRRAAR